MRPHLIMAFSLLSLLSPRFDVVAQTESESPRYCMVFIGPNKELQIKIGVDQNRLLIFRGGLESSPESYPLVDGRLSKNVKIPSFRYGESEMNFVITDCFLETMQEPKPEIAIMVHAILKNPESTFKQYCYVEILPPDQSLHYAHFDGPLEIGIQEFNWEPIPMEFVIGGKPTDIRTTIDTTNKEFGCWTTVETGSEGECHFAKTVRPTATVEFPSADAKKPIIKTYRLDEFC